MNVLLLAFESEGVPIGQLAKRFIENGHKVKILNVDHYNIKYTNGFIFDYYKNHCLVAEHDIHTLRSIYEQINVFNEDAEQSIVDFDFLGKFEKDNLPENQTLNKIFSTDTLFYRVFHHRDYYYLPKTK